MRFNELHGLNVGIFNILLIDSVDAYLSNNALEVTRSGFVSYVITENNIADCKTVTASEFTMQNSIFHLKFP